MEPVIKVEKLVKKYKKSQTLAVDSISLGVNEGEFFAFLGPNGAGKTTTISILTTTLAKTSGTIEIAGFDIDKQQSQVRQNIGVIFQNPSLDMNLTAEENIRFHAVLYGLHSFRPTFQMMDHGYQDRVYELAEILQLQNDIFKPIKTFSGGMKRKLEIIRSLLHQPKVLFLDEPTSGLDPEARKNLWEYLRKVREIEKTTIFLTTHYLEEAESADNVAIINKGKIVAQGTPREIKGNLIKEYLIIDSQNRDKLKTELTRLNLAYEVEDVIKVSLKDITAQQALKLIDTPLSTLKIHNPTLEEAYLEIVENKIESDT